MELGLVDVTEEGMVRDPFRRRAVEREQKRGGRTMDRDAAPTTHRTVSFAGGSVGRVGVSPAQARRVRMRQGDASSSIYRKLVEAMHDFADVTQNGSTAKGGALEERGGLAGGGGGEGEDGGGGGGGESGMGSSSGAGGMLEDPDMLSVFGLSTAGFGRDEGHGGGGLRRSHLLTRPSTLGSDDSGMPQGGQDGREDDDDEEEGDGRGASILRVVEAEVDAELAGLDVRDAHFMQRLRKRRLALAKREKELARKQSSYKAQREQVEATRSTHRAVTRVIKGSVDYGPASITGPSRKSWKYYNKKYEFPVSFPDVRSTRREYDHKRMRFKPVPLPWDHWDEKLKSVQESYRESVKEEQRLQDAKWKPAASTSRPTDSSDNPVTSSSSSAPAPKKDSAGLPLPSGASSSPGGPSSGSAALSGRELDEANAIFNLFDSDSDNQISIGELRSLIDETVDQYPHLAELIQRVRYRRLRKAQKTARAKAARDDLDNVLYSKTSSYRRNLDRSTPVKSSDPISRDEFLDAMRIHYEFERSIGSRDGGGGGSGESYKRRSRLTSLWASEL